MRSNESKEYCKAIIGEAIAALINEQGFVTNVALLQKLQGFLSEANAAWQEAAVRYVISEMVAAAVLQGGIQAGVQPGLQLKNPLTLH